MSLKKSPTPNATPSKKVVKVAMFLGLGMGFSGELAGSAWLGWWVGHEWRTHGGPVQAPGLCSAAMVMLSLGHIVWLLYRLSLKAEDSELEEDSR